MTITTLTETIDALKREVARLGTCLETAEAAISAAGVREQRMARVLNDHGAQMRLLADILGRRRCVCRGAET